MHSFQVEYGKFDDQNGFSSNKFGAFGEVLGESEREFVVGLIWASYQLTKGAGSKLYCCFALPFIGKSRVKSSLGDSSIQFFYAGTKKSKRVVIVPCESVLDVDKVIGAIWGEVRLAFISVDDRKVLDEIEPVWVEVHEAMPPEFLVKANVVVTQFFHGLWLDVATKKYSSSDELFNDIKGSISVSGGVSFIPQLEW
jgi:hypothetical protein